MDARKRRIEFGDFQTPYTLAIEICRRLVTLGIRPDAVVEPTCGVGAFVMAATEAFTNAREIVGFDINETYLETLRERLASMPDSGRVRVGHADFFAKDWHEELVRIPGKILVLGNFPWVTNAAQGSIGGSNLPKKNNFLGHNGFDAISGKANFDISEWMLLEVLRWMKGREGDVAMLVKTAVARKILAHAAKQGAAIREAFVFGIDAKKEFGASVDASLLVIRLSGDAAICHDYTVFDDLASIRGRRVGHRMGLTVGDLDSFETNRYLVGESPQKWRSGVKHDASGVMELTLTAQGLENGLGEVVDIESDYLFPLLKGSDVGSGKGWRGKYTLVTQRRVGEPTDPIREVAPKTWAYLEKHAVQLDGRGSTIYAKNPRFSVFGVGDYAFRPWRIAICGLYKYLRFRLVGPMDGKPVMFDDTVYYVSFDCEEDARRALKKLTSASALSLLSSLVFWDEKRPIKTGVLNVLDWNNVQDEPRQCEVA
ncbi:MAG TPA: class I SAM-dependent methyltransferase [Rhodocyclaceae bacterium]|nr:class I SAM-dependent methyltransferase [Rhodocyclaceae bacterium]